MVHIIRENSALSRGKIWFERHFPRAFEKVYLEPLAWAADGYNDAETRRRIAAGTGLQQVVVETINWCNGSCQFCPASRQNDKRERQIMPRDLFYRIVQDLKEHNYHGILDMQGNNEPLLDQRIFSFLEYARQELPYAVIWIYTNGILLTEEKLARLLAVVDHLFIDNYTDDLSLTSSSRMAIEYLKHHPEQSEKVDIWVTRKDAMRNTRAGFAKNRTPTKFKSACIYPWNHMLIRPDGKVSLCCNDVPGSTTLGDVAKDGVFGAYSSPQFMNVREQMRRYGRHAVPHCRDCDLMEYQPDWIGNWRRYWGGNK